MIALSFGPVSQRQKRLPAGHILPLVDGRHVPAAALIVGDLVIWLGRVTATAIEPDDGQAAV